MTTNHLMCVLVLITAWHLLPPGWEMEVPVEHPDSLLQLRCDPEDPMLLVNADLLLRVPKSYLFVRIMGIRVSLVAQLLTNPLAVQETWVQTLGLEDPLEEGMATHPSILAWRIPMDRGAWRATVHGVTKSQTRLSS